MKEFLKNNLTAILAPIALIIIVFLFIMMLDNVGNNERSSKPRCKCGTVNCNDSNCDPGVERIIQADEVAPTRTIPLEMPPSRR